MRTQLPAAFSLCLALAAQAQAQEPVAWGRGPDIDFHTFSIVAIDPRTGETGVIVTTRNPCVGNAVPWVRVGVGAVATQGGTRVEYGNSTASRRAPLRRRRWTPWSPPTRAARAGRWA